MTKILAVLLLVTAIICIVIGFHNHNRAPSNNVDADRPLALALAILAIGSLIAMSISWPLADRQLQTFVTVFSWIIFLGSFPLLLMQLWPNQHVGENGFPIAAILISGSLITLALPGGRPKQGLVETFKDGTRSPSDIVGSDQKQS